MGFSVSGATALVLIGFLFSVSTLTASWISAQESIGDAGRAADLRAWMLRQGSIAIVDVDYDLGLNQLTVLANNTGAVTYDAAWIETVFDGAPSTSLLTSSLVGGVATDVWAPLTQLELKATIDPQPGNLALFAPTGAAAYWRA